MKQVSFDVDIVEGDHPSAPDRIVGTFSEHVSEAVKSVTALITATDYTRIAKAQIVPDEETIDSIEKSCFGQHHDDDLDFTGITVAKKFIRLEWVDHESNQQYSISFPNPCREPETLKLRLQIDVEYTLNGADPDVLERNLQMIADRMYSEGLITDDTDAEIETYQPNVIELD